MLESRKKQNVLEIGCGTGRHTQKLLKQNNKVTGIDISEGMLEVAKKKLPAENLTLLNADYMTHDFAADSFDVIVSSLVVEHIENLELLFQKVRKILKPGGEFYLSEIHPDRTAKGIMAHFKTADEKEIHLTGYAHKESDFKAAAEKASLQIKRQETILGSKDLTDINPKWEKHLNHPLIKIWQFQKP